MTHPSTAQPVWWAKVYNAVIRRGELTRAARLLYFILVGKADATTGAVPTAVTTRWLREMLAVDGKHASRASLDNWLRELSNHDLLTVTAEAGLGRRFTVQHPTWITDSSPTVATAAVLEGDSFLSENEEAHAALAGNADHFAKLSMRVLTDTNLTREQRTLYAVVSTFVEWSRNHSRSTYVSARTLARHMGYDCGASDGGRSSVSKGLAALQKAGYVRMHAQIKDDGTGRAGSNMLVLLDAADVGLDPEVAQGHPAPMPGYRFADPAARASRRRDREANAALALCEPPTELDDPQDPVHSMDEERVTAASCPGAEDRIVPWEQSTAYRLGLGHPFSPLRHIDEEPPRVRTRVAS